jgi:hypothetical protein
LGWLTHDGASFDESLAHGSASTTHLPSEFDAAFSGVVSADKLVDVREVDWSGHVFDFETSSGTYTVNGITSHNCKHVIAPASVEFDMIEAELLHKYGSAPQVTLYANA